MPLVLAARSASEAEERDDHEDRPHHECYPEQRPHQRFVPSSIVGCLTSLHARTVRRADVNVRCRVTATARSLELRSVAQGIADELPSTVEEVVLTGSVSRGVADDISDIEMLIVTEGEVDLGDCFLLAARCGVTDLGTWGEQGGPTQRVSGYRDAVPVELIWWSRAYADSALDSIFTGAPHCERGRDRQRSRPADVRAAGAVAGTTAPLPGRARQRTDRGCGPQMGRLPCRQVS